VTVTPLFRIGEASQRVVNRNPSCLRDGERYEANSRPRPATESVRVPRDSFGVADPGDVAAASEGWSCIYASSRLVDDLVVDG
jgi:hypothetical protein